MISRSLMGILNLTPDSFYPESRVSAEAALERAQRWERLGLDLVDLGGESSRPGSLPVPPEEQLRRLQPAVRLLAKHTALTLSIDTTHASVMEACAREGATWLNDISALADPDMIRVVREWDLTVVLMHKKGEPLTMQENPFYDDVVKEVHGYLLERAAWAESQGVPRQRIWLDPGIGFGKRLEHNLALLRALPQLASHGYPVLVGLSRKRWIADLCGEGDRLPGSLVGAVWALRNGASRVRVHDVEATLQALRVMEALWTTS